MAVLLTNAPAVEPVSVADAKAYLRVDGTAEDVLIASLILTSRLHIEAAFGLALIDQGWRLVLDRWPADNPIALPLRPLKAISAVRVRDAAGAVVFIGVDQYLVDALSQPGRLVWTGGVPLAPGQKAAGIEIDFTAGYGAAAGDVPAPLRQAVLLLVAHWYEHRDPIEVGSAATAVPGPVSELLAPFRLVRL